MMKEEISVKELNGITDCIIVDIRDKIAFEYGSIEGAVSIPQKDIMKLRKERWNYSKLLVCPTKPTPIPHNFQAVSSKELPLPVHLPPIRKFCFVTRPQVRLTHEQLIPFYA